MILLTVLRIWDILFSPSIPFIVFVVVRRMVHKFLVSTVRLLIRLSLVLIVLAVVALVVALILPALFASGSFRIPTLGVWIGYVVVLVHALTQEVNYLDLLYSP